MNTITQGLSPKLLALPALEPIRMMSAGLLMGAAPRNHSSSASGAALRRTGTDRSRVRGSLTRGWALAGALFFVAVAAHAASPESTLAAAETSGKQAAPPACTGWGGKRVARTELFFGLMRRDGSTVSEQEFHRFVEHEVTPRFPDGLTLLSGTGQFRDANGTAIKEGSKLLILLYRYDGDNSRAIESIRTAYAKTFQQESVLRVDGDSCVSF